MKTIVDQSRDKCIWIMRRPSSDYVWIWIMKTPNTIINIAHISVLSYLLIGTLFLSLICLKCRCVLITCCLQIFCSQSKKSVNFKPLFMLATYKRIDKSTRFLLTLWPLAVSHYPTQWYMFVSASLALYPAISLHSFSWCRWVNRHKSARYEQDFPLCRHRNLSDVHRE